MAERDVTPDRVQVTVRYFAGARAAAGRDEEQIELDGAAPVASAGPRHESSPALGGGSATGTPWASGCGSLSAPAHGTPTIATLASVLAERHGPDLARVLAACTFLLDEVAGSRDRPLRDGAQVDVLPPFAGG